MPISQIVTNSIANEAVVEADLANSAVTTVKIANAAVTPVKLSQPLTSGTAQASTSGTFIDFTGIPSWVRRITVMLNGVSTNGSSNLLIQLGDSGGIENTGYTSAAGSIGNAIVSSTAGYILTQTNSASWVHQVVAVITSLNSSNTWMCSAIDMIGGSNGFSSTGSKSLSDILTQVRITTVNGTDAFDLGSINILYE
jgi:hypothetical protein